jgi:hypothetical protein
LAGRAEEHNVKSTAYVFIQQLERVKLMNSMLISLYNSGNLSYRVYTKELPVTGSVTAWDHQISLMKQELQVTKNIVPLTNI